METLQALIGADAQTSTMLLEMSGGDIESAVAIYFSMQEGEGSMFTDVSDTTSQPSSTLPEWHNVIWPSTNDIPECWRDQTLRFDTGGLNLSQTANGPCGVLAAFQAAVIAQCHLQEIQAFYDQGPSFVPPPQLIAETLKNILIQNIDLSNNQMIHIAKWDNENIIIDEIDINNPMLYDVLLKNLYCKGGCILLIVSILLTKENIIEIKQDMLREGGISSLITPITYLCSMELISLILCGKIISNILAYDPITKIKQPAWSSPTTAISTSTSSSLGVGLLSTHEYDGQPLADDLKNPLCPVWILHGGDHFTVLFSSEPTSTTPIKTTSTTTPSTTPSSTSLSSSTPQGAAAAEEEEDVEKQSPSHIILPGPFTNKLFYHFNGLRPNGPRMSLLKVTTLQSIASIAPNKMVMKYRKPLRGEIEDIVQGDKRSEDWTKCKFEIILAKDDNNNDENNEDYVEEIKTDNEIKIEAKKLNIKLFNNLDYPSSYEEEEDDEMNTLKWRCRYCYSTRFKTMCFGLNNPTTLKPPTLTLEKKNENNEKNENVIQTNETNNNNNDDDDKNVVHHIQTDETNPITCDHCGKLKSEAGYSIWLPFNEIPEQWQRVIEHRYGPKIIPLLRTKWPDAVIDFLDKDEFDKFPSI